MRQAEIYYKNRLAGKLTETDDGEYVFEYDAKYTDDHPDDFITFTMPVRPQAYQEKRLFPVFEGLIPEGWLLETAVQSWRVNRNDRMGLLMVCCKDCIGALSVKAITPQANVE